MSSNMSSNPTRRVANKRAGTSSQSMSGANGAPAAGRKEPAKPGARSKKTVDKGPSVNRLNQSKILLLAGADILAPGVSLDELDDGLEDYYTAEQRRKDEEKQQKELNWKHKSKIENVRSMMLGYVEELEETDWMYQETE